MRSEKEMMELILNTAMEDPRIRAVYMGGSRTNPYVKRDIYQDYDIVYVVTETDSFLKDKNWILRFGDLAIVQEPDLIDISLGKEHDFSKSYTWLMLFKDGNRIDLGIKVLESALEDYKSCSLTTLLLDKDNIMPPIPEASDRDYIVKKPTEAAYKACCNEFWWCLNNVGKGIARDELTYTMWMYNVIVRDMLMKMLEWYIGIKTDFQVSVGKEGKFFKNFLPKDIYKKLQGTYCDSNYENLWKSIEVMTELFREIGKTVGKILGYEYNEEEDKNIMEYLVKCHLKHYTKL